MNSLLRHLPRSDSGSQRDPRSKTGEFTKFFRGGFNSAPPQPPVESDSFPAPSSGKREGEFTRMFNSPSQPTPEPKGLSRVSSRFSTVVLCRKKALH